MREAVRSISKSQAKDSNIEDVVITFKRCKNCANPYDNTQQIGFILGAFCLIYWNKNIKSLLGLNTK